MSVREHRLYATDGALPDYLTLDGDNLPASLGESPEAVIIDSVNRLVWTIVFDNADPGERFRFSVFGALVCFDWYGNEQIYSENDVLTLSENTRFITYDYSSDLAQYNPGYCEWFIYEWNGGYIAELDFELVP